MRDEKDVTTPGRVRDGHDASRVEYANGEDDTDDGDCKVKQTRDEGH